MATIAIGDVHANHDALEDLLQQVGVVAGEGDAVVFLGDYIDRGAKSKECVDLILSFTQDSAAQVICLCGNHEDWLLRTLHDHTRHSWLLGMEAFETIRSYSVEAALALREAVSKAGSELYLGRRALPYEVFFDRMPRSHIEFFEGLRPSYRSPDCICTHGGLDPRILRLEDQSRRDLIWGAGGFPDRYEGNDIVVYGHWDNADLDATGWPRPRVVGPTIGIDTIKHGVLTAIRLPDGTVFQSARHRGPEMAGPDNS